MPSSHSTVSTPNPRERSLLVTVEESVYAANPFLLPPQGTKYKDFDSAIFSNDYNEKFNDYLYTEQVGTHGLAFAKFKTKAEADKPFRSKWKKFGNHRWCPLLKGLAFVEDANFPTSTNIIKDGQSGIATSPRNYVREIFIQEVNEGSRFMLDEFFGPFPYSMGRYPVPQPGRISYQINGVSGSFEECLHDDIEIPSTSSATVTYLGSTVAAEDSKVPGQFFPRTNFRRRRPYVLAVDQEFQDGGYYMQRLRVFPPRQPRTTVQ